MDDHGQIASLRAALEAGFAETNRRFEREARVSGERHRENLDQLSRINGKVRHNELRLTEHEGTLSHLHSRLAELAARYDGSGLLTLANLKWYLTVLGFGAALTYFVLSELLGWTP